MEQKPLIGTIFEKGYVQDVSIRGKSGVEHAILFYHFEKKAGILSIGRHGVSDAALTSAYAIMLDTGKKNLERAILIGSGKNYAEELYKKYSSELDSSGRRIDILVLDSEKPEELDRL